MTAVEKRSVFALVPARGGSKGLPRKNSLPVAGVPLVANAIRTAQRALGVLGGGRVVCSTDDPELAAIAREWGAAVPFMRPLHLATDEAASMDVVLHALEALSVPDEELVLVVQPTSPLSTPEDVLAVAHSARTTGAAAVSVAASAHPQGWQWGLQASGELILPAGGVPFQRQAGPGTVRPTGAAYAASAAYLRCHRTFLGPGARGVLMPEHRALDIDHEADLVIADAVLRGRAVAPMRLASGRAIGPGHPCFVIAEAGVNHNGKLDLALKLIDAAAAAGADAVKFQTFKTERAVSRGTPKADYQVTQTGAGNMEDMIRSLELSPEQHELLWQHARGVGITIFSSPFDIESVALLQQLGVPLLKLASGELTNRFMLEAVGRSQLPVIMSTGMATLAEVERALQVLNAAGAGPVSVLHCVSTYPAPLSALNLRAMVTLQTAFGLPTGWSDHSKGAEASLAAVAMGGCIIEKHLTLDCTMKGPDHAASMEPDDFASMTKSIRAVEAMMGKPDKVPQPEELNSRRLGRRSLVAAVEIPEGTTLTRDMLDCKRPGTGVSSLDLGLVVGRKTRRKVPPDSAIALEDLD